MRPDYGKDFPSMSRNVAAEDGANGNTQRVPYFKGMCSCDIGVVFDVTEGTRSVIIMQQNFSVGARCAQVANACEMTGEGGTVAQSNFVLG